MFARWKWKVSGALTLATLGFLAGSLLVGGAWLISLLGMRFVLALAGVGAFLGWGWSLGKANHPAQGPRVVRVVRRQPAAAIIRFGRHPGQLPDSIRRRLGILGCGSP